MSRYRDYSDRADLVICGDCSTRATLHLIPRDEIDEHDVWHTERRKGERAMSFDWRKAIADGDAATTEVNGEDVAIPPIPDFTPNVGPFCNQQSPGGSLVCTLHPHPRNSLHVAGNDDQVVGIWYDGS